LFTESKIVISIYNNDFEGTLNPSLADKVKFDKIDEAKIATIKTPNHTNILKSAIENSDAVIKGSESISDDLNSFIETNNKPVLEYQTEENLTEAYLNFYANEVLAE
jgi:starch synthase